MTKQYQQMSGKPFRCKLASRCAIPLVIVVAGCVVSGIGCYILAKTESRAISELFANRAEERYTVIAAQTKLATDNLNAVRALFRSSQQVERDEFERFADSVLSNNSGLESVEWAPKREEDGLPVTYSVLRDGGRGSLGFDVSRGARPRACLDAATRAGNATILRGDWGVTNSHLICLAMPIYRNGAAVATPRERAANTQGFLIGTLNYRDIVEQAFSRLAPSSIDTTLVDASAPPTRQVIYHRAPFRSPDTQGSSASMDDLPDSKLVSFRELRVADGTIGVRCAATPQWLISQRTYKPAISLVMGLALTAVLAGFVYLMLRQRADLEHRVRQRTSELAKSEHRFRTMFESTSDAVMSLDGGRFVDCNQATLELFRCPSVEMFCSYHPSDLSPPTQPCGSDSRKLADEQIATALRDGRNLFEWTHRRLDGTQFPTDVLLSALELDGKPSLLATVRDISERKRTEQEVRKLTSAIEQSPASVVITNLDGNIEYVNPSFKTLTGYTTEEVIGQNPRVLKSGNHEPEFYEQMWKTLASGRQWRGEICNKKKNGELYWEDATISAVLDERGAIVHFVAIKTDVTARKRAEEELREARRVAEEANKAKSQFLASMSHELRTPLNGVIGMAELLCDTGLDSRQQRFAEACRSSAASLLDLINDILDFSKIEAGKLELEEHEFQISQVVEDATQVLAPRAYDKELELIGFVESDCQPTVLGDSTRLRQILVNLLSNAIKFTDEGEVCVRVMPQEVDQEWLVARFEVSDTGIGIPPDGQNRLFQSFSQVDTSTTRKYGGTGLGLAICRSLTEAMGGKIGVESEEGSGSTFWFTARFRVAADASASAAPVPSELRQRRVLIVSGSESLRSAVSGYFSAWGIPAEAAETSQETLTRLRQAAASSQPFDLIVVDDRVPGSDGEELALRINRDVALSSPAIIVLAGIDRFAERGERAMHWNGRYVAKPVCQSRLFNAVVELCEASASLGSSEPPEDARAPKPELHHTAGKPRILLAEDHKINQMVAMETLRRAGLDCDCVANGAEAVAAAESDGYDLILMDCHMPEMDGFEATRRIRELERSGHLPRRLTIIALTANAIKGDRERCLEAGMDDYISKPFKADELVEVIYRAMAADTGDALDEDATLGTDTTVAGCPIDVDMLLARCMGNASFAQSLLDELVSSGPDLVAQIAAHVSAGEAEAAADTAHALKGAAAIMAAEHVRAIAEGMETAGFSGDIEDVASSIEGLRTEMQSCLDAIPGIRSELAAKG